MFVKRIQLGLIHVALTMTLLPITSTLNRVMIADLALSATLVAVLASLPYLFSPIQVAIGNFSDRNPVLGWRRSPYILVGLLLCTAGLIVSPHVAYLLVDNLGLGILLGVFAFGLWGMGYNFATVSYFSLASELSGEKSRGRTIAIMFIMMVLSIIFTAEGLGSMLENFSPEVLFSAFNSVAMVAFGLGMLGLIGLEPRHTAAIDLDEHYTWREMYEGLRENRQVLLFFRYLILILIAVLGQDVLLEPYSAQLYDLPVSISTRLNSITGTFTLISLVVGSLLERKVSNPIQARIGAWMGVAAFSMILISGFMHSTMAFYVALAVLGLATGLITVSNLALMLDMTVAERVGMFMGVWGMANAASRLAGNLISGALRDGLSQLTGNLVFGYQAVFGIELIMLLVSLYLLRSIDVARFRDQAEKQFSYVEKAAMAGDA